MVGGGGGVDMDAGNKLGNCVSHGPVKLIVR